MKQLINSLLINYSGGRGCAALLGDGYLVFFALCFFSPLWWSSIIVFQFWFWCCGLPFWWSQVCKLIINTPCAYVISIKLAFIQKKNKLIIHMLMFQKEEKINVETKRYIN
jgi:hypothetical protein